jgi:hypothetical protein
MSCYTRAGLKVYAVVKRWMGDHPESSGWYVFEDANSHDGYVSIPQEEGRRMRLPDQQVSPTLTPEVERRILNWLENLSGQPTVNPQT